MTVFELAVRVVKCKNWRWLPGMVAIVPARGVGRTGYMTRLVKITDGNWLDEGAVPDLTDPATLGGVISLYDAARKSMTCPDPVYTMASCYGLPHEKTVEAMVVALESA